MEEYTIDYELTKIAVSIGGIVVTIFLAFIGYWWAQRSWRKQKEMENILQLEAIQYKDKAAACKAVWSLLPYLANKETPKNIFIVRSENHEKVIYCRKALAEEFYDNAMPDTFYAQGHGIFMPDEIRDKFFDARIQIRRLIDAARNETDDKGHIKLKTPELAHEVWKIHESLTTLIRNEIANGIKETT